ncbi:MAG: thioredoxin-disulfide reductase [Prosthecochloris sp.]|nr:thioredoxin-disulfide reductase [Prosthecochloris sp.]
MNTEHCDVLIIGGGPAGASAAIYTARAELQTLVLDKDPHAGALGMAHVIANYPGVRPDISGMELLASMKSQAEYFGAHFMREKVTGIDLRDREKVVFTASGKLFRAKALILATGSMGKSREIPGERELVGAGVSYCATCDAAFYKGQVVAVSGRTGEAVEEAKVLSRFAGKVYLLCPTTTFAAPDEEVESLGTLPNVDVLYNKRISSINGEEAVESLSITGDESPLFVDGVFLYLTGSAPILDYAGGLLEVRESGCLKVNGDFSTSVPGVFAAGDVLCKDIKQAVIVASEGCRAALQVDRFLSGREKAKSDYH